MMYDVSDNWGVTLAPATCICTSTSTPDIMQQPLESGGVLNFLNLYSCGIFQKFLILKMKY